MNRQDKTFSILEVNPYFRLADLIPLSDAQIDEYHEAWCVKRKDAADSQPRATSEGFAVCHVDYSSDAPVTNALPEPLRDAIRELWYVHGVAAADMVDKSADYLLARLTAEREAKRPRSWRDETIELLVLGGVARAELDRLDSDGLIQRARTYVYDCKRASEDAEYAEQAQRFAMN